jgi:DNA-binding transcriptional regulator YiaG
MVMAATASVPTMAPADLLIGLRERVPLSEAQVARGTGAETERVRAWLERREAPHAVHRQRLTELVAFV